MNLQSYLAKSSKETNEALLRFFPKKFSGKWFKRYFRSPEFALDETALQKSVVDPIWDFLDRGGKRWRPGLLLLACEATGGNRKKAVPFTVLPELIHNGTIMVDDVEDSSTLRRGKPSTHLLFGVDVAVNAGNAMYFLPLLKLFSGPSLDAKTKSKIYDLYVREMVFLSFGQATDIHWHHGYSNKVSESEYLQMCSFKTGSLSRFAAQLGAILGGASEKQVAAFADFATSIGVAFQIQDDILNLVPSEGWGKETGDDISEGKRTLIVIRAFSVLPKKKKRRLIKLLDSKTTSVSEIQEAISILSECGAMDYASSVAKKLVLKSWSRLDGVLKDSDSKKLLKEFAGYLIEREV